MSDYISLGSDAEPGNIIANKELMLADLSCVMVEKLIVEFWEGRTKARRGNVVIIIFLFMQKSWQRIRPADLIWF